MRRPESTIQRGSKQATSSNTFSAFLSQSWSTSNNDDGGDVAGDVGGDDDDDGRVWSF